VDNYISCEGTFPSQLHPYFMHLKDIQVTLYQFNNSKFSP